MSDILDGYIITIPASLGTYINGTENIEVEGQTQGNSDTQKAVNEWNSMTLDELESTGRITQNMFGKYYYRMINVVNGPYDTKEECINAYRQDYFLSQQIDLNAVGACVKTGADFINGTSPSNTNVADLLFGRINTFRSTMSPWGILSENVAIDMDPVKGVSVDLFRYLQITGILMGMVLILSAIVGYITAQAGQARAQYKASAMHRVLVTCIIAGTVLFLSFVMEVFNLIFGV